jgi:hypothetical protein
MYLYLVLLERSTCISDHIYPLRVKLSINVLNNSKMILSQGTEDRVVGGSSYRSMMIKSLIRMKPGRRILPNREQSKSVETLDIAFDENSDKTVSSASTQYSATTSPGDIDKTLSSPLGNNDDEGYKTIVSCLKFATQEESVSQKWKGTMVSMELQNCDRESSAVLAWPFTSRKSHVQFDSISVHFHTITLGDNPSVSEGPPIGIGWDAQASCTLSISEYEETKPIPRERQEMLIPSCVRESMLMDVGFVESDLIAVTKCVQQIQLSRRKSMNDGAVADSFKRIFRSIGSVGRKSSNKVSCSDVIVKKIQPVSIVQER